MSDLPLKEIKVWMYRNKYLFGILFPYYGRALVEKAFEVVFNENWLKLLVKEEEIGDSKLEEMASGK